jgi:hypothetical protein
MSANFSDETVDLAFEMQRAAPQVGDCEVIGRVLKPRLGNFVLQGFAPTFQVFDLAWPHIFLHVRARSAGALG